MKSTANDLELILNQLGIDPTTLIPVNITGLTIEELDRISAHVECGKSFVNCCRTQSILNADVIVQGIVIVAIGDNLIALDHRWLKRGDYYLDPTFSLFNSTSSPNDTYVLSYFMQIEVATANAANDSISDISIDSLSKLAR
ncbi:hypothetical protein [Shewanella sp. GD03713]|uniref:hypothetical protein n=1 Tax=Shewanella sp. GD03713 TaxID=2975372 RepID=UPI00244D4560|nr:hypothetical protein [Shewanella sp. GD03713]MDH1472808.1 hypothetical protein [Shewanella sp. GD03713]